MKEEKEDLSKRINPSISESYEKTVKTQEELIHKKEVAKENKKKLEDLIKELDNEKNRDVKSTVKEVDRHFNSIFSILLPNVKAKLE